MKLTKKQVEFFRTALEQIVRGGLELPGEMETGITYSQERYRNESRGYVGLQFVLKPDDEGQLYLDYYFETDDMTSHHRIDSTGAVIRLENIIDQWTRVTYEDEEENAKELERCRKHNQQVHAILKAKGFKVE